MKNKWQNKQELENQRLIQQEQLILDVTESVLEAMEHQEKSRSELASEMGRSQAYVSQLLNGTRNMTLRTLADIGFALKIEPRFEIGFRDQLCQDTSWMSLTEQRFRPNRKILCYDYGSNREDLSGQWVDACPRERAA